VSRFRSPQHCAVPWFANFGTEGHWIKELPVPNLISAHAIGGRYGWC
jgi:hypothetical protein